MAVTVQMQFTSAVTEMYQDAFVGSAIENGTTIIQFDLRQHDFHDELGTQAKNLLAQGLLLRRCAGTVAIPQSDDLPIHRRAGFLYG